MEQKLVVRLKMLAIISSVARWSRPNTSEENTICSYTNNSEMSRSIK
jgi:hypothetical protein